MHTKKPRMNLAARVWKTELGCFLRACEAVDSPRSLTCYLLARSEEWAEYLALSMPDPDREGFADDYLVTEAMRKNPRLPGLAIDRKAVAKARWIEAENACRATNQQLRLYRDGGISIHPRYEHVLTKAQAIVAQVLGKLTPEKLRFAEESFRFGPGATSSCSGRDVVLSRKMVSRFDVTPGLYPYWRSLTRGLWAREITEVSLRSYSTIQFVPKDAKTDRPIGIEPHGNIFVQLGLGNLLRRQLRRYGLNLDNQADKNRQLASRAQKEGLSTIDLSSASDTISLELVWLLLPPDWAYLLDLARTGWSKCDGRLYKLEKFSAMGNGYTFELESLIFMALARACGDDDAVSFGDDIIVRREVSPLLIATLNLFGFSVNERKTYLAGRFFESCGADYHDGVNVRPFYLRGDFHDFTSSVIRICNKLRIYAHRRNNGLGCDIRFLPAWLFCLHRDAKAGRTGIPLDYGDDGLIRNFDEAAPARLRHGHCGFAARVWRVKTKLSGKTDPIGSYLAALHRGHPPATWTIAKSFYVYNDRLRRDRKSVV